MHTFAGQFTTYNNGVIYIDDDNTPVTNQWRWIDDNQDGIAECYRFDKNSYLVANATLPDGKKTNNFGQWIENDIVQRIYYATMQPLKTNRYQDLKVEKPATPSRINASGKNLEKIENDKKKNKKTYYLEPNIKETESLAAGQYLGKKIVMPQAEKIEGQVISAIDVDSYNEDGTAKRVAGKDMSKYMSASKNCTKEMTNCKIYGGTVWDKCMCLAGHDSYAKFTLDGNNYMYIEVAHQAHGTSTAETECYLELYIDGDLIDAYDGFVDSDPLVIEEWFESGNKTVELRWKVPSGSQGRKLYIRDGVFRKVKSDDE